MKKSYYKGHLITYADNDTIAIIHARFSNYVQKVFSGKNSMANAIHFIDNLKKTKRRRDLQYIQAAYKHCTVLKIERVK